MKHILIIDDMKASSSLLSKCLYKHYPEVKVKTLTSGNDIYDHLANSEKYDLIFLDIMMPEKDGPSILKEIRALNTNYTKSIPIIAYTSTELPDVLKELGFTDYLFKGTPICNLLNIMKNHLNIYSSITV